MSLELQGQGLTFISDLELVEVNDGVFVNWTIDSGYTCQGVDVLHSIDGNNFDEVGHIFGVCGSLTKPVAYSFLHEDPIENEVNYYRLKINGYGYSEILNIFILKVPDEGVLIYPNPVVQNTVRFKFNNPNAQQLYIQIIDSNGKISWEGSSTQSEIELDVSNLIKGVYKVRVISEEELNQKHGTLIIH